MLSWSLPGAIAAGRQALGGQKRPDTISEKQAYAAVGQARLMMVYQKLFAEYNHVAAQVLLTKDTMTNDASRYNAQNTFDELMNLGVVPIVNENDTVSTHEIQFGDNDRLSAIVAALIGADLLILLSDIDGLYSDDPPQKPPMPALSARWLRSPPSLWRWGRILQAAMWEPGACRLSWRRPGLPRTAAPTW